MPWGKFGDLFSFMRIQHCGFFTYLRSFRVFFASSRGRVHVSKLKVIINYKTFFIVENKSSLSRFLFYPGYSILVILEANNFI